MVTQQLELKTQRLVLRLGMPDDILAILHYYRANRAYLEPFEPQRPDDFYTRDFWRTILAARERDFFAGQSAKLLMFLRVDPDQVIGTINLNNIVRGALHGATLGYGLSAKNQGQGYMTEAGQRLVDYAFAELNLHRIAASYMPHNYRSANVLKRLGFQLEGVSRDFLFINGQWQDHVMTSLTNPSWQMPI